MDVIAKFILDHFLLLVAIVIISQLVLIGINVWKRKKSGLVLPKPNDPDVVFAERFASGSSNKSWMTRMGGASNCLIVVVTKSHLAVTPQFPFNIAAQSLDLEHLIPISDITKLAQKQKITEVEFQHGSGTIRKISLRLRNAPGFLDSLQERIKVTNQHHDQTDPQIKETEHHAAKD